LDDPAKVEKRIAEAQTWLCQFASSGAALTRELHVEEPA